MNEREVPEGDRIYDLYTGAYKAHIIRIALALDVFSPLDSGPASAETVARACGCDTVGVGRLLDYLTSLNILERQGETYSLSADAATFLVRGKKSYAGDLILNDAGQAVWELVGEAIRVGQPRVLNSETHFAQDAWIESYRAARIPSSLEMWSIAGIVPKATTRLRLLDIACGCAVKTLVLARESPGVDLVCLDSPLVLEAARDLAERWGVSSQVQFRPENLLIADFGAARYDACLLGQITHFLTAQQNCDLYARILNALVPGGMLVLDVPMESPQLDESAAFVSLALWANSGGRAYSFEQYRAWLEASGFVTVTQLNERTLSARR